MKPLFSAALIGIALAGCTSIERQAFDACPLTRITPPGVSQQCYETQLSRLQAQETANENAAAMLLLGATAFANGYNNGQSGPLPMVNQGGRLTIYSGAGGMLQGY